MQIKVIAQNKAAAADTSLHNFQFDCNSFLTDSEAKGDQVITAAFFCNDGIHSAVFTYATAAEVKRANMLQVNHR